MPGSFKTRAGLCALGWLLCRAAPVLFAANDMNNDDPNLWLEDVAGERSLQWVRAQNALSTGQLEAAPGFAALEERLLRILNSRERIPFVAKHGRYYYNFWRDDKNVRGLWRRTTLEEYKKPSPAWETVLDLDQLAAAENENWVWHGYNVLQPRCDRCLVELSRGGADAAVLREFDLTRRQFTPPAGFPFPRPRPASPGAIATRCTSARISAPVR